MTASRVHAYLVANGVPVVGVAIGTPTDRSTWTVQPASLQAEAQPLLEAFVWPTAEQLLDEAAGAESRRKDILATIAWAVRLRDVAAWNALTLQQKRAAVFAQADIWRDLRVFLDS